MTSKMKIAVILTTGSSMTSFAYAADPEKAGKLEDLTVMTLSAIDGRSVIKMADGKMLVLKVSDEIPGTQKVLVKRTRS
jgi:hypothetical protein